MKNFILLLLGINFFIPVNAQSHFTIPSENLRFKNVPGNTTVFNSITNGYHIVGELDDYGIIVWSDSLSIPAGTGFIKNLGIGYFQDTDEYVSIISNPYVEVGFADSILVQLVKFSINTDQLINTTIDTIWSSSNSLYFSAYTDTSYLLVGVEPLTSNLGYSTWELSANLTLDSLSAPDSVEVPFASSDVFFSHDTLYCLQLPNPSGISLFKFSHSNQNFSYSSDANLNIASNTNFSGSSKWRKNFGQDSIIFFYEADYWKKNLFDYNLNQIDFCEVLRPVEFDPISENNVPYSIENSNGQILFANGYFYILAKAELTNSDVYAVFKFDHDLNLICKTKIQGYSNYEKLLVSVHDEIYLSLSNSGTSEFFRIEDNCGFSLGNINLGPDVLEYFPNPTRDIITIQTVVDSRATYSIISANGQTIIEKNLLRSDQKIDISDLKSGVYYLLVMNGDKRVYSSMIVKID